MPIPMSDMQQMAKAAYPGNARPKIGAFSLFYSTPTLRFYHDDETIVVSVRGTFDARDATADGLLIIGKLNESERYKEDLKTLELVQSQYPPDEFNYIAVGHSLGGAIIDRFLRAGLIRGALSYNPAPEPQELGGNPMHRRVYHSDDPIYRTVGQFIPNVEVRRGDRTFWGNLVKYGLPFGLGFLANAYFKHGLGTFHGGLSHLLGKK
jgi:hypothetical protein